MTSLRKNLSSSFRKKHPSGKHRVGLNKEWLKQYTWLYFETEVDVDGNSQDAMFCRLCRKHQSHGSNGSQTWSNVGYKLLRKDKVQSHQDSDQHKYSVTLDLAHGVDDMASNINTSAMIAVKDALEVLFFMLQHNLALDLFSSLIDVGAQDLPKLRLAKNATYSSWDTVHDLLNILSKHVKQILLTNMNNSPCYATMVEEVTDNRTIKHLAICTRFINQKGVVQNGFLTDIELPNATANSITSAITT